MDFCSYRMLHNLVEAILLKKKKYIEKVSKGNGK